jgi:hypothetical protein
MSLRGTGGWDETNAILPEPASSHANGLKTRMPRNGSPTIMTPAYFAGDRVHAVLARIESKINCLGKEEANLKLAQKLTQQV